MDIATGSMGADVREIRPKVYGMFYAPENNEAHVNLHVKDPITVYVQNAVTMAQSAISAGMDFKLVTNDPDRLARVAREIPGSEALVLQHYDFTLEVPRGINFQSAHYKLELLRAFGTGAFGEYCAMVDIDAVLLRPLILPDPDQIYFYDITPSTSACRSRPRPRPISISSRARRSSTRAGSAASSRPVRPTCSRLWARKSPRCGRATRTSPARCITPERKWSFRPRSTG